MPGGDIARIFGTIFSKAEERAQSEEEKSNKAKQEDIQMYQKVLFDPNSSPEQRQKAADQITKLRGINKKESPFGKIAGLLTHVKSKMPQAGGNQPMDETNPATGKPPIPIPNVGAIPQPESNVGQPQSQPKPRGAAMQALGRMFSGQGLIPRHPQQLTPIDPSVFPTADQVRTEKGKDLRQTEDIKWEYEQKKLKLQEELKSVTAAAKSRNAMSSKEKYLGQDMINALPEAERQGLLDANGIPVDPNGVYGPATGQNIGLAKDEQGNTYLAGVRVGTGPARVGTSQQYVYNPATNKFELTNVGRSTNVPQPPKIGEPSKPGKSKKELTPLVPGVGSQGKIPLRSFGPLQKQSNAINEARNSLIGDELGKIGGMAKDIDIFKNPQSVQRVGQYIKYVNSQLEEQGKMATGMGPMAAVEWYTGLPSTISNLQQEALSKYSGTLDGGQPDGPEHQFVANYYRLLGTWGGMRAATGASAARWSFKNLISEMPTPGPVTTYGDAQRRIRNMANESNVVAKTNPMVPRIDVNQLDGKSKTKDPKAVEDILRKHKVID